MRSPHTGPARGSEGAGVHRMRMGRGIVSEANASRKARGYADGDTVTWMVKAQVAVNGAPHRRPSSPAKKGSNPRDNQIGNAPFPPTTMSPHRNLLYQ